VNLSAAVNSVLAETVQDLSAMIPKPISAEAK
jgi:hypothetical protein